jgi:hypothetical protein
MLAVGALLLLPGCKNRGKKGDSDAPEDGAGTKSSKADGSDPGARAGEGDPHGPGSGPGRNRNARDLVYLTVDGERCDRTNKREHQVDVNQDGYADLITLYATEAGGEVITCKQADLNFDGRLDAFIHYGPGGEVVREQFDTDFDGRIDVGRYYEQGKLVRDELDLNQDGYVDTWRIYDNGRLVRIETDRDADGRPDMFTYYVGKQIDRIGYDTTGDGKVNTWDHDAARRARLALQRRRGAPEQKPDEDLYVDEGKGKGGDDGKAPQKPEQAPQKPKSKAAGSK